MKLIREPINVDFTVIDQTWTTEEKSELSANIENQRKGPKKPIFGCAKGEIHITPDFDEPLEDFKEYM